MSSCCYLGGEEKKQTNRSSKLIPLSITISGQSNPIEEMSYQDYPPPGTYGSPSPYPPPQQQQPPPVYPPQYAGGYPYQQDPSAPSAGPGGYSYPPPPPAYQGYFNPNQNYPPPPLQPQPQPQTLPPYEVYQCEHDDRDDCSSFLRGCLTALCFCFVLDECCG